MAKVPTNPRFYLKLAESHLKRVRDATSQPDWADLGTYGLYCLEALVRAAALKSGETPIRTHWGKADQATNLSKKHKLPDITSLLRTLNLARKANAYGDEEFDETQYDANDTSAEIEQYYAAVKAFISK